MVPLSGSQRSDITGLHYVAVHASPEAARVQGMRLNEMLVQTEVQLPRWVMPAAHASSTSRLCPQPWLAASVATAMSAAD